jgi:hypothetical protein
LSSARGAAGGGDGPVDDGGRPVNGRVEHGRDGNDPGAVTGADVIAERCPSDAQGEEGSVGGVGRTDRVVAEATAAGKP